MEKISHSSDETKQIGQEFAATLTSGAIVCLHGDLGAGKTTLVKGIAEGLGITEDITSPTFTLMNVYTIHNSQFTIQPTSLVHIDTYRLKNEHELIEIGVEDYLGQPGVVTIIEWPEKIEGLLKDKKITSITLEHLTGDQRKITIT
jgi:tRNA threonylcarbamoyladenosine biosynthesis protein TsaE